MQRVATGESPRGFEHCANAGAGNVKTARFSEVVARSGTPEIHLTWTAPASDRVLQAALKQSRVLTVHQQVRGAKKDFGMVGLETGPDVQFLVFPKSLRSFAGRRVVGINYELLSNGLSLGTKPPAPARAVAKAKSEAPPRSNAPKADEKAPIAKALPKPRSEPKLRKESKLELRTGEEPKPKRKPEPKPKPERKSDAKGTPEPIEFVPENEDDDPVKVEIRRALTDLSMGHVAQAKRRLAALLDR